MDVSGGLGSQTRKKIASLFYSWSSLRNLYNLVFAKISPDEELFPFHNCGRKALSDVQKPVTWQETADPQTQHCSTRRTFKTILGCCERE